MAVEMINKYHLRTLDSIQLASAILSDSELFIASDEDLYKAASKQLSKAIFI